VILEPQDYRQMLERRIDELERENAALREVLNRWKEICEMGLPDVVMPSLKPALFELWDATDTAINAARANEGGAS
jgi:hypothetical protein